MNQFIDSCVSPGVWFVAGWSLRWALFIALVACWFAIRRPRHASARDAVWRTVLVAGLLVLPNGAGVVVLIHQGASAVGQSPTTTAQTQSDHKVSSPAATSTPPVAAERNGSQVTSASTAVEGTRFSRPDSRGETSDLARLAVAMLAGAWALGVALLSWRLVAGWRWLAQFAEMARAPSEAAQRQFTACRQECNVPESVVLRMHPGVSAPVFVGAWQRRILVPDHWDSLPAAVRRGVLMHELAHVARRDDQMKLLEEIVRVFFFFHPCVHYMLNRLEAEREEICDAAAVCKGISPRELAETLLLYSCRANPRGLVAYSGATLQFFRGQTVKHRIVRLLLSPT